MAVSTRRPLVLTLHRTDPRKWVLALTVDGKPVTIEGRDVSIDGWSCVDASPDGKAVAAGDLVQHGGAVAFPEVDAQAELPLGPKVGDLHPWDALVDGCLYIDEGSNESMYAAMCSEHVGWVDDENDPDIDEIVNATHPDRKRNHLHAAFSAMARVLAVGLKTADDFRAAIVAHRTSLTGGAK
jgi:hypothetical protein